MRTILAVLVFCSCLQLSAEERAADHQALRELLTQATAALNKGDADALAVHLAPGFRLTFADQTTLNSVAALGEYRKNLETTAGLTSIVITPEPDGPTTFLGESTGFCTGRSRDAFTSAAGTTTLDSRWTATVVKDASGAWKIATFHSGVDLMRNPILDHVQAAVQQAAMIAGAVGLIVGALVGFLLGRRRRA